MDYPKLTLIVFMKINKKKYNKNHFSREGKVSNIGDLKDHLKLH
jgi:hypothetical protein